MSKRDRIIAIFLTLCVMVLIVMAIPAMAQDSQPAVLDTAPVLTFECPAGQTCHILWQSGSQGYNLCAGQGGQTGRFNLEMFGADSNLLKCVGQNQR